MDPENDIYGLAAQSGVLPAADPGTNYFQDIGPSASAPQQSLDPILGSLTDEDVLAHFVPQTQEGPVTQPSQVDQLQFNAPAPAASTPTKVKVGKDVTTKGYSEAKNQQIARGPGARLDNTIRGIEDRGAAEAEADSALPREAAAAEKTAALGESQAEANYRLAEGKFKGLQAQIFRNYDLQTEKVIAEEQAKAQTAKASYVAALNDFRAARVNPAQLWDNMSGGEQVGMMAAAFVQDFLGAKGIHTSAMATFNKAIDRNIDAQVKAIETKGRAAEGFKALWDMQMAESSSKEEARLRMRGFMLDTMKTAIESNMSQYSAALATAKGQTALAKIDQELVKTINEVNKHQDAVTGQRIQQALTRYGDELQASTAYARIKADKEIAELNRKAAKGPGDPYEGLVFDTTESGNGKPIAQFNADVDPTTKREFLEKQATSSKLIRLSREYQSLLLKNKNQGLLGGTRWQDSDTAKLRNVAYEILNTRIKMQTGAAMSEPEAKRIKTAVPEALFGTQFNVREVVAQTQKHIQDELAITQQAIAHPLHPDDPRRTLANPLTRQGETEFAEAGLVESGKDREEDIEKSIAKGRIKGLEAHTANKVADAPPADVYTDYKRFTDDYGHESFDSSKTAAGSNSTSKQPRNYAQALTGLKRDATFYKHKAEELADRAAELKAKGAPATETEVEAKYYADLYQERVDILRHQAKPVAVGTNPTDRQGLYSIMMLHDLGEDAGGTSTAGEELEPTVR